MADALNLNNAYNTGGLTTNILGTTDPNAGGTTYGAGNTSVLGLNTTDTSGTGTTTGSTAPALTSYQQSLQTALPGMLGNISNTAGMTAGQNAGDYGTKIQDFLDSSRLAQSGVDTQGNQNELSRIQGSRGVLDMVGQGIKSGGVMLGNKNAGTSSATEALARAYGILGRTQQTGINNQYDQGQVGVQNAQHAADVNRGVGVRDLGQFKQDAIGNIVQQANYQLGYLNQQLANASLPDQINIQQQIDQIKQQATDAIGVHDPELSGGVAGINPTSTDQRRNAASQLSVAGTAPENQFSYTSQFPAQFQNTGPSASSLPLFQLPGSKKATA